jgi:hypothetical protein
MLINLTKVYSGVNLYIDLVLPDDPDENPARAGIKCRSNYLGTLRNRPDLFEFLEKLALEEVHKVNPGFKITYSNNDFFGEKELSLKLILSCEQE